MRTDKNKLFTIGQFAGIHEVTKKTLMWYDEMDLLKPAIIGENGYRYYTYSQSPALELILMLRELNVSISEIKSFLSNRSVDTMEQLLREKITELEDHIAHLKNVQKTLVNHHQDMMTLLNLDLSEISIVQKEKCYLAIVPMTEESTTETEIELVIEETKKRQLHRLHDASYGSMISVESLYQGNFNDYSALYIEMPYLGSKKGLHLQPAGTYLCAFCKGSWDKLPHIYEKILAYAKKQGLSLYGYSYETGINESVINNIQDYITQIEIPIKPKMNDKQ